MLNQDPSVAIILLNWNGYNDTYECLKSLETLEYSNFHVFLVDNASKDDSFVKLTNDFEEGQFSVKMTLMQSGGNLGFAGGNNVAIKKAYDQGYQYIWLLNNDTTINSDALSTLVNVIHNDDSIGIVGSKIYFAGTDLIWFAGGNVNVYTGATNHIGIRDTDLGQYNKIKEVSYIVGCSLLFRRELIDRLGYLVEDYFLYFEDTDWNIRAKQAGWKVVYVPTSIVHHKVSSSQKSNDVSPQVPYYLIRNAYLMVSRTQKRLGVRMTAVLHVLWKVVMHHIRLFLRNQNNKRLRSGLIFKGAVDAIKEKAGPNF